MADGVFVNPFEVDELLAASMRLPPGPKRTVPMLRGDGARVRLIGTLPRVLWPPGTMAGGITVRGVVWVPNRLLEAAGARAAT